MKKKIIFIVSLLLFLILLASCENKEIESELDNFNTNIDPSSSILIVYFSATGNTKRLAGILAEETKGDLFEIEPEIPYSSEDLNYNNPNSRANKEQNDSLSRPKIKTLLPSIESYDVIFIATALWWGSAPKIIATFIESYDFTNKTIIPVCTSASSGIDGVESSMKSYCKNEATFLKGKRFSSSFSEEEARSWIQSLNIKIDKEEEINFMYILINQKKLKVELVKNSATTELVKKLKEEDLILNLHDYGSFEKTGPLGFSLPKKEEYMNVSACDVVLYLGSNICIYYDKNSWDFTPLGKIQNVSQKELKEILGEDDVVVTLSLQ